MASTTIYTRISDLISAIYENFSDNDNYVNLSRFVAEWEEENPNANAIDAKNLFSNLQKLEDHLIKNSLTEQSEKVSRILVQTFPELLFPKLPNTEVETSIDLRPLKDLKTVLRMKNYPDSVKEAARRFDENFRKAIDNAIAFSKDVDLGHFRERGSGVAGELFRQFKATVLALSDPALADIPWALINQLALQINNDISSYNAAYLILKNLNDIKTSKPSPSLNNEIKKHTIFFRRNSLWEQLDKATNTQNFRDVLKIVDKLLPLANSTAESASLRLMKKNALKKIEGSPRGCILLIVSIILLAGLFSLFADHKIEKRDKIKKYVTFKKPSRPKNVKPPNKQQFKGKSGLFEELPPIQPYDKALSLAQIRYAMYQQQRISYLTGLKLSASENAKLALLIADWKKRCAFYKYNTKDRERIDFEVKNYKSLLLIDANNILKDWRKNKTSHANMNKLLNLSISTYASKVQSQLAKHGYYKGKITGIWDKESKRALAEFKTTNTGAMNSKWDLKTQKKLFPSQ